MISFDWKVQCVIMIGILVCRVLMGSLRLITSSIGRRNVSSCERFWILMLRGSLTVDGFLDWKVQSVGIALLNIVCHSLFDLLHESQNPLLAQSNFVLWKVQYVIMKFAMRCTFLSFFDFLAERQQGRISLIFYMRLFFLCKIFYLIACLSHFYSEYLVDISPIQYIWDVM